MKSGTSFSASPVRAALPALCLLLFTFPSVAQVILRAQSEVATAAVELESPSGRQQAKSQPATFAPTLTVLLDPALIRNGQAWFLGDQISNWMGNSGADSVELVLLPGVGQQSKMKIRAATELDLALEVLSLGNLADSQPSFAEILEALRQAPREGVWREYVYAGPEPTDAEQIQDFAEGLLARVLSDQRIRLSHWNAGVSGKWTAAIQSLGGKAGGEIVALLDRAGRGWREFPIPDWKPVAGFRVAAIGVTQAGATIRIPWIWGDPAKLPTLSSFADFKIAQAEITRRLATVAGPQPEIDEQVDQLLAQNPDDVETLKLATELGERANDFARAARYATALVERETDNGPLWARLGIYQVRNGNSGEAERALLRARALGSDHPRSAAILGDIHFAEGAFARAAEDFREAVRRENDQLDLWLKLADSHQRLGQDDAMAQALEEVLSRDATRHERRAQLIDHYLERAERADAARHLQLGITALPPDALLVARYATYAERLTQPQQAIALWSRSIEIDSRQETAHFSLANLHLSLNHWDQSLAQAEAGLMVDPNSSRLHGVRADALVALGRFDQARQTLRDAATSVVQPAVLTRGADLEDRYGTQAPAYYRALVEGAQSRRDPEEIWRPLAERGIRSSIRGQQMDSCAWFAKLLEAGLCAPALSVDSQRVTVPGGYTALLFMARGPARSSPKAAMGDYSRTLTANFAANAAGKAGELYGASLVEYFDLLADLKAMGTKAGTSTKVRLSLENKQAVRNTERVLALLGWQTRTERGKRIVENTIKGNKARRQDLASALAIDVIAMQEELQAGRDFLVEIADESVEVFPEESMWQQQFYKGKRYVGGFVEALARNPDMASLYASLASMEQGSARLLVTTVGMKRLAENYASVLALYAPAIEIAEGRVRVPGGNAAGSIWAALVGEKPENPGRFLRALLDKDDAKLIRFYFMLSQLDGMRQKFFTASQKRMEAFYEAFRDSEQVEAKRARVFGSESIQNLFRELPIDADGKVLFPGSPEVWLVARNNSSAVQNTERRLARLARVTTPEVEDEILLRLITKNYEESGKRYEAWQNLLAVVRVEAAHTQPLDEESALLLAEKFAAHEGLFGYFTQLGGLGKEHYREIFTFAEKLEKLDWKDANIAAGLFQSGIYVLGRAETTRRLESAKSAKLLLNFVKALNQSKSSAEWAEVSLDFVDAVLTEAGAQNATSFRELLVSRLGEDPVVVGPDYIFAPMDDLRKKFDRVLALQKVPPLDQLLGVRRALKTLASGQGELAVAGADLISVTAAFQDAEMPPKTALPNAQVELIRSSELARIVALNKDLAKALANKKLDSKRLHALSEKYWKALAFRTTIAMAGQVYAAYFDPEDLLIAEDPLLLRKHTFVVYENTHKNYFPPGGLHSTNVAGGSYLQGSFAGIATMAGDLGAAGLRNINGDGTFVAAALLGSIRTTDWARLNPEVLRAASVQVHAAQDWLILSVTNPRLNAAIADSSYGLLSLNRRARLLVALQGRDWDAVWSSVSRSDMFFLASRLRENPEAANVHSPAIDEFRALSLEALRGTRALGPALTYLQRLPDSALIELAPYEEAAAEPFPQYLAERVAEFKLYLACVMTEQMIPAGAFATLAERAAERVLGNLQMSSLHDWQSVLSAYSDFDAAALKSVLESQ